MEHWTVVTHLTEGHFFTPAAVPAQGSKLLHLAANKKPFTKV